MRVGTLEIQIMAGIAQLQRDMNNAQRTVGGAMSNIERSVAGAKRAMQTLGVGLPLAMITDQVRRMTDSYTKLDAQLRLSTKSQASYAQGMSDIRRISSVAQADLTATSMLYTRLMNVMEGTGVSQAKIATVTETVSYGLKAFGATAQEASSAALQLSQAMGANRLGGEEFRATMEAMPNVMKVLAKSMGVPLGELRALSIAGKITAEEMVKAFGDPAIAAEFKRLAESAQTITGAWVVARNELTLLVGEFMKSSGVTGGMIAAFNGAGAAIRFLADNLGTLVNAFLAYVTVIGGKYLHGMIEARIAQVALNAAHGEALVMNVAHEAASLNAVKASYARINATSAATVAETRMAFATVAAAEADSAATVAQLNHARASGILSGNLHIVRAVEAELVVATNALNAATARRVMLTARLTALEEAQVLAKGQLTASTVALAEAEKLQAVGSITIAGRIKSVIGMAGWIGMAIFGAWTVFDLIKGMRDVGSEADTLAKKIEALRPSGIPTAILQGSLEHERRTIERLQKEMQTSGRYDAGGIAALGAAKARATEYENQIAINKKIEEEEKLRRKSLEVTHDELVMQGRMLELAEQFDKKKLTEAEYLKRVNDELYGVKEVVNKAAKAVAKANAEAQAKIAIMQAEMDGTVQLTDSQKKLIEMGYEQAQVSLRVSDAKYAENAARLSALAIVEQEVAAAKTSRKELYDAHVEAFEKRQKLMGKIIEAEREHTHRIASSISEALVKGIYDNRGTFAAVRDIIRQELIDKPLQGKIALMVTAGVDWTKALIANTLATKEASAKSSGGDWIILLIGAILGLINNKLATKATTPVTTMGDVGRGGFINGKVQQGFTGYDWSPEQYGDVQHATSSGADWDSFDKITKGVIGTTQVNAYNNAVGESIALYAKAGDVLGYSDARTKDFTAHIEASGDIVAAIGTSIGNTLIPAIKSLGREGETLQQTATRLTETFKATNDFINALGVSQDKAFGGFGLGSAAGRDALIAASGGLQSFNQNAKGFVDNFLTPAQKMAPALDTVGRTFAQLGINGVETNDQFAALVKQQMELGNTDVVAQLLSVADSFNAITKSAAETNSQLKALADQDTFKTMVDYQRALAYSKQPTANAGGLIAGATAKAGTEMGAEAVGTAAWAATHPFVAAVNPEDLTQSGLSVLWSAIKELGESLMKFITGPLKLLKEGFEALTHPVDTLRDGFQALMGPLTNLKDLLGSFGLGGGGGDSGGLPMPPGIGGGSDLNPKNWFANGGVFTNNILSSATPFMFAGGGGFNLGVMGEAGSEAIMPLGRGSDGVLGVRMQGGGGMALVVAELRALRAEVVQLRSSSERTASNSRKTSDLLRNVSRDGQSLLTEAA